MNQQRDFKKTERTWQAPREFKVKQEWIAMGINDKTVEFAEEVGKFLAGNRLTTSQIRNVFGELKRIQMKGFESEKTSFYLLKPKMAYAAKRNENVGINAFKDIFNEGHKHVANKQTFENFVSLIEAILAYHKAFGGKEN
jgi:CRISPR-associated protein Csm2